MLYSKSTQGFYISTFHSNIPADAVEITDVVYNQVCANRLANKILASDKKGYPILIDPIPQNELTQSEKDISRFIKRANVKDSLLAWMAADNMSRIRSGEWTLENLKSLLIDLSPINSMMQTLSFELAAKSIQSNNNPLMTAEIKDAWVAKLTEHFYTGS